MISCITYFLLLYSEQKRRLKAESKAKEKAEKAEKAPPVADGPKKNKDAIKEEEISPNEYFKLRSSAVQQLKLSKSSPYPHKYHVDTSVQEFIEKFTYLTKEQALDDQTFSVAGIINLSLKKQGCLPNEPTLNGTFRSCSRNSRIWA